MLSKKLKIYFVLVFIGVLLSNIDYAYKIKGKKIQGEGIESYDSLLVINGDTSSITVVKNHLMNIEIQGNSWDIYRRDSLLGKCVDTSSWKIYKNTKFNVLFKYPPSLDIKIIVTNQDTSILLTKKSLDQIYNPQSKRSSKKIFSIRFGNYLFEDVAYKQGFSKHQGLWYTEGRTRDQAIYLIGNRWYGLIGDCAYGTQVADGSFGLCYSQIFIVLKNISNNRSAYFDFYDIEEKVAIGIISSLKNLK